jgi:Flp pilus assembly protein TadD
MRKQLPPQLDRSRPFAVRCVCKRSGGLRHTAALLLCSVMVAGCTTNVQLRKEGHEALDRGNAPQAREAFAYAIERRPADAKANYGLGLAYLELNRPLDARLAFEKALSVKHDDPELTDEILDGIAESLFRQERFEQLHAFLDETAGDYGESDDYLRQARYLVKMGDLDAAVVAFRKAAYFAPEGDAEPYLEMSAFYDSINDQPNALRALRYAYWVDPDHPDIPDRFRAFGKVPGPTLQEEPPKPEIMQ